MAHLYEFIYKQNKYYDKIICSNYDEWKNAVINSRTVYVGNLYINTKIEQIKQLMKTVGEVDRVIMGLNRIDKTPCGFCFVVYKLRRTAREAVNILDGSIINARTIRVDEDLGFIGCRRYGRGKTGAQRADERSKIFDEERPIILSRVLNKGIVNPILKENNNIYNHIKGYTYEDGLHYDIKKQRSGNLYKTLNRIHPNYPIQNNINSNYMFNNNHKNNMKYKWQSKMVNSTYYQHINYVSGKNMNWKNNNSYMRHQGENKYVRKTIHKKRYPRAPNYAARPKPLYNIVNINKRKNLGQKSTLYPNDKNKFTFKMLNESEESKEEE